MFYTAMSINFEKLMISFNTAILIKTAATAPKTKLKKPKQKINTVCAVLLVSKCLKGVKHPVGIMGKN